MVGRQALDLLVGVRIPLSQPSAGVEAPELGPGLFLVSPSVATFPLKVPTAGGFAPGLIND